MKKHLENFTIHQFRGLRELSLSGLGQINLLAGPNNCGKTTVLEAVSVYCRPMDPLEWLNTAWRREIKSSRFPLSDALKWLFPQTNNPNAELYTGETRISASGSYPVIESKATYSEFLSTDAESEDSTRKGADLTLIIRTSQQTIPHENFQIRETFQIWEDERFISRKRSSYPECPVTTITPFSHRVEQTQIRQLTEATFKGMKELVIEVIRQIDSDITDIEILSPGGTHSSLYIHHQKIGIAPLSVFGDGLRRLLMIAMSIPSVSDGILLIDEIETAIHISALEDIFRWLVQVCKQYNIQLFATTHSLEAVDAILKAVSEDSDDLVAYRLAPSNQPVKRFAGDLLYRIRYERGLDVR